MVEALQASHDPEKEALRRRVKFLEKRLSQAFEDTRQDYSSKMRHFESVQLKILQLFLEKATPGTGLSHVEIKALFEESFPAAETAFLARRVQELAAEGLLWRFKDETGTVRFYLKLREEAVVGG